MKQIYTLIALIILSVTTATAQTYWTGPKITFTKAAFSSSDLEENQDRITDNVWITRRSNGRSLYNAKNETFGGDTDSPYPSDTSWAIGKISDGVSTLTFRTFGETRSAAGAAGGGNGLQNLLNVDMVLHLITDNIYIDIKFLSWSFGNDADGGNGGFSYERSTNQALSTDDFGLEKSIKLFPNPSTGLIQLSNLKSEEAYSIYTLLGAEVSSGTVTEGQEIDIQTLSNGVYFLKLDNGNALKFLKE